MAEDSLLINLDLGIGSYNVKPSFKGGSWKDKLTAKKATIYNREKIAKQAEAENDNQTVEAKEYGVDDNDRPAKRQRIEPEARFRATTNVKSNTSEKRMHSDKKPRQVISSLFSFNPPPETVIEVGNEAIAMPAEPSNAPLKSELATFTSLGLSTHLSEHLLLKMKIRAPTAIQRAAITQLVKEDTDAFIQAETGSGKTLAYLLPIVQRIMSLSSRAKSGAVMDDSEAIRRDSGLFAIILVPTRELSKQILVVLESLLQCAHWIVPGIVIGGEKKKSEKARLRKGLNILVATPGRLADHLDNTEVLNVGSVRWLILDEGDRLMELGFEQDITRILSKLDARTSRRRTGIPGLPGKRTTVLCSATMKMDVQRLGEISLKDAVHIHASDQGKDTDDALDEQNAHAFSAPAQLKQSYAVVPAKLRLVSLTAMLKRAFARRGSITKAIVFISCADSVDFHFEIFARPKSDQSKEPKAQDQGTPESNRLPNEAFRTSAPATAFSSKDNPIQLFRLHGSLPQAVRTSTLSAFRHSKDPCVLVCTDVASRGLDLPNVDFVIEFDPPFNKDDHLHRIGRTARAGKDGRAMIFLLPGNEEGYVDVLREGRREGSKDLIRNDNTEILKKGFGSVGLGGGNDWEDRATEWQLEVERWTIENPRHLEQARKAFQSHVRAYATHVAAERSIFNLTTLHLGHLAKAFALRDKPGSIRVPGLRPGKDSIGAARAERKAKATFGAKARSEAVDHDAVDGREAARKMGAKMKEHVAGASEFNLG